jgi:anti-sigma regulatory factor (Ser/Thr protein kinase)
MGRLRVAIGELAPHASQPGQLLSFLDGFAAGADGAGFATACYAVLDPATGQLGYASAGHPPMLVVTADGRSRWLTAGGSAPITGHTVGERPDATEILEEGALLVLYSDGLVERRGEPITAGLERLERAAIDLRAEPVRAISDGLFAALGVTEHRDDDVVVLCLRVPERAVVPFREVLASDPRELSRLRRSLQAWRRMFQPADRGESDLLVAVNEACANAIEHAYRDGAHGTIEITVVLAPDGAYVATVRDFGTWRPPVTAPSSRGRGLNIIRDISHGFELRSTAEGTLVRFRLPMMGSA